MVSLTGRIFHNRLAVNNAMLSVAVKQSRQLTAEVLHMPASLAEPHCKIDLKF